jgi:chromosome condensin MukBEF complex kleisin-like MukF subunit
LKYSLQSIRDRISLFSDAATAETFTLVKEKLLKYINQLKDMLMDCANCKSPMSESCKDCIRIQETIGWALEKLRKVEKKK